MEVITTVLMGAIMVWVILMGEGQVSQREPPKGPLQARLEAVDDVVYAYEAETDTFLGQGRTLDELVSALGSTNIQIVYMDTRSQQLFYSEDI